MISGQYYPKSPLWWLRRKKCWRLEYENNDPNVMIDRLSIYILSIKAKSIYFYMVAFSLGKNSFFPPWESVIFLATCKLITDS